MTIQYWIDTRGLQSRVKTHFERIAFGFESRKEEVLGRELESSGFPVEQLIEHYWKTCREDSILKYAVETAVKNTKHPEKVEWAKQFVRHHIISMFGYMIKYRTWKTQTPGS